MIFIARKLRLDERTTAVPLLPPIDQWGYEPFPLQPLTPHSLSRRTRDLLAGDLGAHRDLPIDPAPEQPHRKAHLRSGRRKLPTERRTRRRHGNAAAVTWMTWPGSSTCSPTSNAAPTNSTGGPRNCWTSGCRDGFVYCAQ